MDDLRQRFAALDRIPAPDLWTDIERRAEGMGAVAPNGPVVIGRQRRTDHGRERAFGWNAALLLAALVIALILAAAVAVGSGLIRVPAVVPPTSFQSAVASPLPPPSTAPTDPAVSPSAAPTGVSPKPLPTVPPDSMVVAQSRDERFTDVFTFNPTTHARSLLTTLDRAANGSTVQLSADRQRVSVFQWSDVPALVGQFDVAAGSWTDLRLDGEALEQVAVAPSGDRFAMFLSEYAGIQTLSLVVRDLQQNELYRRDLSSDLFPYVSPVWAPDGSAIAFAACLPCNNKLVPNPAPRDDWHIFVVRLDGTAIQDVIESKTAQFTDLSWSPDMTSIAFAVDTGGIRTVRLSDAAVTKLTTTKGDIGPVWSDDGSRIAFVHTCCDRLGIWTIDADGTNAAALTSGLLRDDDRLPVWSADGRSIIFERGPVVRSSRGDLWMTPVPQGDQQQLLTDATADW